MATFFDKFRKYAKDYVRERPAKEPDAYGHLSEALFSTLSIKGLISEKRSVGSTIQDGHNSVGVWVNAEVMYVGPEVDLLGGDRVIDGSTKYTVEHIDWKDDFKNKNSHKIAYLKRIS